MLLYQWMDFKYNTFWILVYCNDLETVTVEIWNYPIQLVNIKQLLIVTLHFHKIPSKNKPGILEMGKVGQFYLNVMMSFHVLLHSSDIIQV